MARGKFKREEIKFLQSRKMGDLIHHEWMACEKALTENNRPNFTLFIPEISGDLFGWVNFIANCKLRIAN